MKATLGAGSSSATPPACCKCRKEATETRRVRDCGRKLTMDGKLSRKEVRKRREKRGRKGEKSCQKGNEKRSELERVQCKWRTTERERG